MGKIITVDFRQDTLFAVERDDGVFVALKPISDSLGLKWHGQFERLQRDAILSEGIRMIRIPSPGGVQETTCLRLDLVHGWLFTIDESRVKDEETRQKVLTYKRECYSVLFRHFFGQAERSGTQQPAEPMDDDVLTAETLKLRKVNTAIRCFGERAGAQLWRKLGLELVPAMLHSHRQGDLLDPEHFMPAEGVTAQAN